MKKIYCHEYRKICGKTWAEIETKTEKREVIKNKFSRSTETIVNKNSNGFRIFGMKKFSDFAIEEKPLEGSKVRLDDILNKEIEIKAFKLANSRFSKNQSGKYATIQFLDEGKLKVLFTGSDVLISQLEKYENELPFLTTIIKINRYYTFT